jgi:hypothetical protein
MLRGRSQRVNNRFRCLSILALLLASGSSAAQDGSSSAANPDSSSGASSSSPSIVSAQVPFIVKLSGRLKAGGNDAVSTTAVQVTFSIFGEPEGGQPIWSETQNVQLDHQGRYTALLGSMSALGLPVDIFANREARWIETSADGFPRNARIPLVTVPYALKAADADTFAGRPVSNFVQMEQLTQILNNALSQPIARESGSALVVQSNSAVETASSQSSLFARLDLTNEFPLSQSFQGGAILPAMATAPRNSTAGMPSTGLDLIASVFNLKAESAQNELFRWQAEPVQSGTASPSARLSLLFGSNGATPKDTGFFINSDGTLGIVAGQQIPLNAIQAALNDAGLTTPSSTPGGTPTAPIVNTAAYSWQQTPGNPLKVGSNTVTMSPCPRGVNGTDTWHYLYVSGAGTPEAVLITGGTCTSAATSGTIQFTAAYAHAAGYKLESATGGVQEAINAAVLQGSAGQISRSVLIDPQEYIFHARLSIRASSITISASGATITCEMSDTCIMLGDPSNANLFSGIKIQGVRLRAGVSNGTWPAIVDNAQGSALNNLATVNTLQPGDSFGYLIQVDNDQSTTIDQLNASVGSWSRCDATFCSAAIYGPGPFSVNAGVIWVQNSTLSFQCAANGIDNQDGNTLQVSNSVVQGYAQFGIRSYQVWSNNPNVQLNNVYEEVGDCTNPLGTGIAGLIAEGGYAQVSGGVGPAGSIPQFASTGQTQYSYYIVVQSSTMGTSPAYLAGTALSSGSGSIKVLWNQVGTAGVITYDVLRVTGAPSANTTAPYGTGNFAIATGVTTANCSNKVCSIPDNAAATPASYTIPATTAYSPALLNWPGSVILTNSKDSQNTGGLEPTRYYSQTVNQGSFVNSDGANQPSVFGQECDPMIQQSAIWMECQGGNAVSSDFPGVVGTLLQDNGAGGEPGGLKGRLIFEEPPQSSVPATHIITLADSNAAKTLASSMHRPSWDAADSYIGYDQQTNQFANATQLSMGAPVSISLYIDNPGDGTNWSERLTSSLKSFKVPLSAPAFQTASNCSSTAGACGSAAAGMIAIAPGTTTITVLTSAVTATSEIHIDENFTYGPALGVTCDRTLGRHYGIVRQTPGVSFVIATDASPTNSACLSYAIVN